MRGKLPGEPAEFSLPPESDTSTEKSDLVAGRTVIRLGNVSQPQMAIYRPSKPSRHRAAVVICPGGGYHILAYDLEGTEVAEWLVERGITAIVLKYRVPARPGPDRWKAAVIDTQRALSLARQHAEQWNLDPTKIGVLGFSAGGHAAAVVSSDHGRQYQGVDDADQHSCRPDFSCLIYPGYLVEDDQLSPLLSKGGQYPPTFLVHAQDDPVTALSSLTFATHLQKLGVPVELHLYREGGHGYGLRRTEFPVTRWTEPANDWLERLLARPSTSP
jgi:acetyl esterase/lipase